jgi:hypothetical protein
LHISAAGLSNLNYPDADRGANLVLTNAIGTGGGAAEAIIQEFIGKRVTKTIRTRLQEGPGPPPTIISPKPPGDGAI